MIPVSISCYHCDYVSTRNVPKDFLYEITRVAVCQLPGCIRPYSDPSRRFRDLEDILSWEPLLGVKDYNLGPQAVSSKVKFLLNRFFDVECRLTVFAESEVMRRLAALFLPEANSSFNMVEFCEVVH
jgi:hypothetical protein